MTTKYENIHRDVIESCKKGDVRVQYQLYSLYNGAMYNICYRMTGQQEEAEDMLQESFSYAFSKLGSFRFFTEEYRKALQICGTKSGRDCNKVAEAGLTPMETERGNVIFQEARLVLECRKVYVDRLRKTKFILPKISQKHYPSKDFHHFYMGEIMKVNQKK